MDYVKHILSIFSKKYKSIQKYAVKPQQALKRPKTRHLRRSIIQKVVDGPMTLSTCKMKIEHKKIDRKLFDVFSTKKKKSCIFLKSGSSKDLRLCVSENGKVHRKPDKMLCHVPECSVRSKK